MTFYFFSPVSFPPFLSAFSGAQRRSVSGLKIAMASALLAATSSPFAHVVLAEPAALANTGYSAALRIGHGCDGASTTAIKVTVPAGFQGAKPMVHAGWVASVKVEKLDIPYKAHGKEIAQDVTEIIWTAASKDHWLPDAHYDEFVLRGNLGAQAGPMWFKVLQTCEKGSLNWNEIPAAGTNPHSLKTPAAMLEVIESGAAGHQH
jgi:periplasmic copper chaperone A